ncbi:hypothetical protein VTJ04DRAFT_238 [Mycothermus thermophilus]|uniref:uncharacterized protein n=1 Tax=Humicola insolens TaxID=85995 RepID=UPI00374403DE
MYLIPNRVPTNAVNAIMPNTMGHLYTTIQSRSNIQPPLPPARCSSQHPVSRFYFLCRNQRKQAISRSTKREEGVLEKKMKRR